MPTYNFTPKQYASKILHLSQHMRDMSYKQDWPACIELEEQRQAVIDSLFLHRDMPRALEDIADIIEQVVFIDSESLYICEEARTKEMDNIKHGKKRQKAAITYHSNFQ